MPCAAAVYYDDMYVVRDFSLAAASILQSCKCWVTNEYQHSGLRDDGYNILAKLLSIVRGGVQSPS